MSPTIGIICSDCGATGAKEVEIARDDEVIASKFICETCLGPVAKQAAKNREMFEELCKAGFTRIEADAIMCKVVDAQIAEKRGVLPAVDD